MLKRGGIPGGRVVLASTGLVVAVAVVEAAQRDLIGLWTGAALVGVSVVASLVTRAGDRVLPAMMPPLAFLAGAAVGGQQLVDRTIEDVLTRQVTMLVEVLGSNWIWVVVATACSVLISATRHLIDRHRSRRGTVVREQPTRLPLA